MSRAPGALVALALLLCACTHAEDDLGDQLRELDPTITDEMVDCVAAELEARGLDLDDSSEQDPAIGAATEQALVSCLTEESDGPDPGGADEVDAYGSDPAFDALWDECEAGDGDACDLLYFQAPIGSEYEDFGYTCGHRVASPPDFCAEVLAPEEGAET